jgi:hypothetical protein
MAQLGVFNAFVISHVALQQGTVWALHWLVVWPVLLADPVDFRLKLTKELELPASNRWHGLLPLPFGNAGLGAAA